MDYQELYQALADMGVGDWVEDLSLQVKNAFSSQNHGDLERWQSVLNQLPELPASDADLINQVRIGQVSDLTIVEHQLLRSELIKLHPWRKGPFSIYGINIDTEWRSDWKWDRLVPHISSLQQRTVLDVGCGNGYHCWRMFGAGAKRVIGIDPGLLSVMQFQAIKKCYGSAPVHVLPIACEQLPNDLACFDTVFSMGVLYHRRSPIDHLLELKACLRPGGELVLETLVVVGAENQLLMPKQRYAQMRNVWFIPSPDVLLIWLERCGFKNIKLVDVTVTTVEEQRTTDWMQFHSLAQFLNPENSLLTCEGLPAPIRATVIANI